MDDGWEFLDEVNVMERWPAEQRANVGSTKWAERRDALQSLVDLIEKNPRLSTATTTIYGEIVDELKKILLKDSNINVVVVAIRLVGALARGLRRHFAGFVGMVWNPLLEKAKDKKAAVKEALPATLDAVAATCNLDRISAPLAEHMQKPSPETKTLLDAFLYRLFLSLPCATAALPFIREMTPLLVKHASDSDASVRDSACSALGGVRRLMGPAMDSMLGAVKSEQPKMTKITEACERATAEFAEAEAARAAASGGGGAEGGECSAAGVSGGAGESGDGGEGGGGAASAAVLDPWTLMDPVELSSVMASNFAAQLAEKKWQDRKDALETLEKVLLERKRLQPSPENAPVVGLLNKTLEKDVNINVAAGAAACLAAMASALRHDFAPFAPKVTSVCFDKFKEKKTVVREKVVECVDAVATTASLDSYTEECLAGLAKTNPACRSQTALFLARLLSQHSAATLPKEAARTVAGGLVKLSLDADAECRDASFAALAALLRCVGETAGRTMMGEVAEDKMRMGKIEKLRDDLVEAKGKPTASEEMRRLHGEKKGGGGDGQSSSRVSSSTTTSVVKKSAASSTGRPSGGGATSSATRPASVAAGGVARKVPSSAPVRVTAAPPSARPSTGSTAATGAARPGVSRPGAPPLSRPGSAVRPAANGRTTPLRQSRENLAPLTLEGAKFIGPADAKTARLAEHRPSTLPDLVRLTAACCSPSAAALLKADDAVGVGLALQFLEGQSPSALCAHSDVVCRWFGLRLAATSTPPTLLQRLLPAAARTIADCGPLSEQELAILVPAIMSKVGDTREVVRSDAKAVLLSLAESSLGPHALLPYLAEGLRSKIIRQKMDTLSMISSLTAKDSTLLSTSAQTTVKKLLTALLECLSDRDALTRTAALNACVHVEKQLRDRDEWTSAVAKLPSKERISLEDRLAKAANGTLPAPRQLAPMPRPMMAAPSGAAVPSRPAAAAAAAGGGLPRTTPSLLNPGSRLPRPGTGFANKK